MPNSQPISRLLPLPAPAAIPKRNLLVLMRRMAIHGHQDASASTLALRCYGVRFRQILVLTRCLLHEIARASNRTIRIATCCTPRMTRDEALLLDVVESGDMEALSALTDNDQPQRALSAARALASALSNISPPSVR